MELYEKNGNVLYILNVLKKYSDEEHKLSATEIQRKIKEIYNVDIDPRTIRRNINLLKYKLDYDISTRDENGQGYYINRNPDTDFEPGEVRAIIDTFSYANYIVPAVSKNIIKKCKNMQNIYENRKLRDYKIYANDTKTDNMEVIKNIEDISEAIQNLNKVQFEYWKYTMDDKIKKEIVSKPIVTPYAIVYNKQEFYVIGIKEGQEKFYNYRIDRIRNLVQLAEKRTLTRTTKEIKEYAESLVEMFGGEKEDIEVKCTDYLLDTVFEMFGKDINITKIDDEVFKIKLRANPMGFKFWAMRNLDCIEVLKPLHLRNEIKEIIEEARNKYC
ncbi:MAG: helix-turn-helix transcriptional regulator [Clostridia bacterium]